MANFYRALALGTIVLVGAAFCWPRQNGKTTISETQIDGRLVNAIVCEDPDGLESTIFSGIYSPESSPSFYEIPEIKIDGLQGSPKTQTHMNTFTPGHYRLDSTITDINGNTVTHPLEFIITKDGRVENPPFSISHWDESGVYAR